MEKLLELIGKLHSKYGRFGLFIVVLIFIIVWGVAHYNAQPRSQVSVLGIVNYQKPPDDEAIKSRRDLNIRLLHIYFSSKKEVIHLYFSSKKEVIHRFVNEEWMPQFAHEFYSSPGIGKAWDTIVREDDKKQRQLFIQKTGPVLQRRLNEKSLELVKPLDELEWRLTTGIREERPNIDKIVVRTIDELDTLLSGLFSRSIDEAQFSENVIELYKSLNPKVDGFEPNLTKPPSGRAKDARP